MERAMRVNNFYIAIYELFGVCASKVTLPAVVNASQYAVPTSMKESADAAIARVRRSQGAQYTSFLPEGTVFEGTLRTNGNVDVAGLVYGDIICQGCAVLHSAVEGNITAERLHLLGCTLTGDINVTGTVVIDDKSKVYGNITARDVLCAGRLEGDLSVGDTAALESTARIRGNLRVGALSMARGAKLNGSVWVAKDLST